MPETRRLTECSGFPGREFVERKVTLESAMKLGIELHLAGLSLSDTVSVLLVECRALSLYRSQLDSEGYPTACREPQPELRRG